MESKTLFVLLIKQDILAVGIWAKGQREPRELTTSRQDSLSFLAFHYDRRMAIEEQSRDTKGARFGLQLVWTQIKTSPSLSLFHPADRLSPIAPDRHWPRPGSTPTQDTTPLEIEGTPIISVFRRPLLLPLFPA